MKHSPVAFAVNAVMLWSSGLDLMMMMSWAGFDFESNAPDAQ